MENCDIMGAQIVDMSSTTMMIQMCDTPERVQIFLNSLKGISIVEISRTGTLAMMKCSDNK